MTTCLGKSCSFGLPRVPFVNCCQFMYLIISLLVLRAGCVSVPDHCLSFYFVYAVDLRSLLWTLMFLFKSPSVWFAFLETESMWGGPRKVI